LQSSNLNGEGRDMSFHLREKFWVVLPMYPACGLILGLLNPLLGAWVVHLGAAKPGYATAISVNILMPAVTVGLAVAYPRVWTALVGAVAMSAAFAAGMLIVHPPAPPVDVLAVIASVRPALVLACVAYAVLGSVAALATRAVKRAGGWDARTSSGTE
jgi:hypothetical protein